MIQLPAVLECESDKGGGVRRSWCDQDLTFSRSAAPNARGGRLRHLEYPLEKSGKGLRIAGAHAKMIETSVYFRSVRFHGPRRVGGQASRGCEPILSDEALERKSI